MARPIKNTVDYFPHYTNHKKTIFILEQQYGNDGYAFWFKLLELLGATEKHLIDCNNNGSWRFLQAKTNLTEEKCLEILNLLVELEAIDKKLWSEKIIWCQNFIDNIADVYKNRRIETPKKPSFYRQKPTQTGVSTDRNPQSKLKESKGNKTKEKFEEIWSKYPKRDGRKDAYKHFIASVKTEKDWQDINTALKNYLKSESVKNGYVKNGSTWFNNWKDWIDYKEPQKTQPKDTFVPSKKTEYLKPGEKPLTIEIIKSSKKDRGIKCRKKK